MSDEKMIFKAKDLIKKEQVFQVEGDTYTNLKLACEKVAYSAFLKRNIQMSTNLNRLVRLTNRLEREFMRGEEKIKPLNTREFITIIYLDYERKPLIKSVLEDIKGLINEFADCYMWLRGDVSLTNFEQVRESLHWQFDKDDLLKTFNKGIGEYFFKTVWEKYDDCEYHYEFELIDFKPLEIEDER